MKLSIIIPVYNEAGTFEELLKKVQKSKLPKGVRREILVVEGSSTDGTMQLVRKHERDKDTKVFFVKKHKGKGYKVRYGLSQATGDIILIQDADLEYDPNEYSDLLKPILNGRASFVLGSRHLKKGHWRVRRFANVQHENLLNIGDAALKRVFWLVTGTYLTDPNTMYKVFRRECLNGISLRSNDFDLDIELVVKLLKKGYRPVEVPVSYRGRGYDEGKKIHPVRDGARALWALLKYRISD
jgi:glycosyltransferase involved in cell wall biosynthesis